MIEHWLRKMAKLREKIDSDPEWRALLRAGRQAEVLRRLDTLVPIEPDGASSPVSGNDSSPQVNDRGSLPEQISTRPTVASPPTY